MLSTFHEDESVLQCESGCNRRLILWPPWNRHHLEYTVRATVPGHHQAEFGDQTSAIHHATKPSTADSRITRVESFAVVRALHPVVAPSLVGRLRGCGSAATWRVSWLSSFPILAYDPPATSPLENAEPSYCNINRSRWRRVAVVIPTCGDIDSIAG